MVSSCPGLPARKVAIVAGRFKPNSKTSATMWGMRSPISQRSADACLVHLPKALKPRVPAQCIYQKDSRYAVSTYGINACASRGEADSSKPTPSTMYTQSRSTVYQLHLRDISETISDCESACLHIIHLPGCYQQFRDRLHLRIRGNDGECCRPKQVFLHLRVPGSLAHSWLRELVQRIMLAHCGDS